jgi:molybdate transport system substrate-binding protein
MRPLAALALAFAAALVAPAAHAQGALVFAAASLKEALDEVAGSFALGRAGRVDVSYAASGALARQIERGAPADLFISADTDWIDYVEQRGLAVSGTRRNLLANDLVLIAPAASQVKVKLSPGADLAAALGKGRLAMADPGSVPAGKYGRAALTSLGAWKGVEARVAPSENVRAALALVARGEAPLGIVYRTDALAEKGVRIVDTFPAASHPAIVYPVVLLKRSSSPVARAFEGYLASPDARAIFERHGFRLP